jgi:hypothetical protein
MIRPVTCICFLLACGAGLYVYQSKHRVQVLDREIEKTVRATDAVREQTRVLHAEWTLMNDPQRLQALANQFLSLKNVTPGQFTSMTDLGSRLPAVRAPEAVPAELVDVPVAQGPEPAPAAAQPEEPRRPPAVAVAPPPSSAKTVSVAAGPMPPNIAEHKPSPQPRIVAAETAAPRTQSPLSRPAAASDRPHPASPRIVPVALPAQAPQTPPGGSALGMARGAAAPPPRPMPVSASQWVAGGGGG